MPNETPQLSLTEIHRDAIKTANSSWSETDKLYVSVCTALIALAAIFGTGSTTWMIIAAFLLLFLAVNWMILIHRYRGKIRNSLKALSAGQDSREIKQYFDNEYNRVSKDPSDYLIAIVVLAAALALFWIVYSRR